MMLAKDDRKILFSHEVIEMHEKYREKFGQDFIGFSYADFTDAELYKEALAKALLDDKPSTLKWHPDPIDKSRILYHVMRGIELSIEDHTKTLTFKYNGKKGCVVAHSESDFDMHFDGASMKAYSLKEVMCAPFFDGESLNDIAWELEYDENKI